MPSRLIYMKKILLLSDTHSHIDDTILKYVVQADEVWHAGDIGDLVVTDTIKKLKPLRCVYGNIDDDKARMEFPLHNRFMCEGVDVWMTHIGGYPGKYNPNIKAEMTANPPKLFIRNFEVQNLPMESLVGRENDIFVFNLLRSVD